MNRTANAIPTIAVSDAARRSDRPRASGVVGVSSASGVDGSSTASGPSGLVRHRS